MALDTLDTKSLPNTTREFYVNEFYAPSGSANATYIGTLTNSFSNQRPAKVGLMSRKVDPAFTRRRIYAYVWANMSVDPSADAAFHENQISLYYRDHLMVKIPVLLSAGVLQTYLLPYNVSRVSACNTGGSAQVNTLSLKLTFPAGGDVVSTYNPEPFDPVVLQPFEIDCPCDRIEWDLLWWAGFTGTNCRFVMISVTP